MTAIFILTSSDSCIRDDRNDINPERLPALQRSILNNTRLLDLLCNYTADAHMYRSSLQYSSSAPPANSDSPIAYPTQPIADLRTFGGSRIRGNHQIVSDAPHA